MAIAPPRSDPAETPAAPQAAQEAAAQAASTHSANARATRSDPYILIDRIGQGGFGVVWLAERRTPFVQRVALKVLKPGIDSKQVVARFEAERQALALMDHPNIARVIDGGVRRGWAPVPTS
jgi:serine/threonine protein kinase